MIEPLTMMGAKEPIFEGPMTPENLLRYAIKTDPKVAERVRWMMAGDELKVKVKFHIQIGHELLREIAEDIPQSID